MTVSEYNIKKLKYSIKLITLMKYSTLVDVYEKLENTSKRLNKTYLISKLLEKTSKEDLDKIVLLIQGKLFPAYDERKIGIAERLVIKALSTSSGKTTNQIEQEWKIKGDLGEVAKEIIGKKTQSTLFRKDLSVLKVFENLRKLSELKGTGTVDKKIGLIAELLTSASSSEAKYITRTLLEDLRVGVGDGSLRDAIVWAFFPKVIGIFYKCPKCNEYNPNTNKCINCSHKIENKFKKIQKPKEPTLYTDSIKDLKTLKKYKFILAKEEKNAREIYNYLIDIVQQAIDKKNDFSEVAKLAKEHDIKDILNVGLEPLKPIKVMLYPKAKDLEDAFKIVGKPAALEFKYDGFRMQIHKDKNKIKIFTRRLEDVTAQFPDVVNIIKTHIKENSFIIDLEAVGFDKKTGAYLPFQNISQRIRRKYGIEAMAKDFPVELNVFDIMLYNNISQLNTPFKERRDLLKKIIKQTPKKIILAKQIITDDLKKSEKFYEESLKAGEEGVMVKSLQGIYKPGSRVGYGVKVKPETETLDLVIVGAEWGSGKRSQWLSSFTIACKHQDLFLEIGKVGTGIKEKSEGVTFDKLTKMIKPLIKEEKNKEVTIKPKIVIEVGYEEIQKSPTYNSEFALRFPRLIRLRPDKSAKDASQLDYVKKLYEQQRR